MRADNHRDRVLADWERDALCQWLIQAGEPAAADLIVFLLETAARWGEAQKLKGGDVDMARGRVSFWQTKTGKPRTVPLTRRAQDALRPHLPAVRTHRVWPFEYHQFRRLFERAKDHTGLGDEPIGIHTLRHTCASKLASAGVSLNQLQRFGGWSSLTALQRYVHLDVEALQGCIDALER
jgi:integrase